MKVELGRRDERWMRIWQAGLFLDNLTFLKRGSLFDRFQTEGRSETLMLCYERMTIEFSSRDR